METWSIAPAAAMSAAASSNISRRAEARAVAVAVGTVTLCHHIGDRLPPSRREDWMTYAKDRVILDADSHVMELGDFLDDFLDPAEAQSMRRAGMEALKPVLEQAVDRATARRSDPDKAAEAEERLMVDK